jgi:PIN domain
VLRLFDGVAFDRRSSALPNTCAAVGSAAVGSSGGGVRSRSGLHLPVPLIRERLSLYARFDLVPATPELIESALALHVLHGTSFYDALILQAAIASGCSTLLTEDMQHGASIGGVKIVNPFADA